MPRHLPARELAHESGDRRPAGFGPPNIEGARLVVSARFLYQAVPVEGAEQRPDGESADVGSFGPRALGCAPHRRQPAQLIVARRVDVRLGDGKRQPVALPCLVQEHFESAGRMHETACGLDIGKALGALPAAVVLGIVMLVLVEVALAGDVVIDADDVRRTRIVGEPEKLGFARPAFTREPVPQGMALRHTPAQQVPAEPAPVVEEFSMGGKPGRAVGLAQIVGLDELRLRVHAPDLAHGEHRGPALVEERLLECGRLAQMGIPNAVQGAEAGGRERLVDRGVPLEPGIAARHRAGVAGEAGRKGVADQTCFPRSAAVVHEAGNRRDAELAQTVEALVAPGPVRSLERLGGSAFPEHWVAQRAHAERCDGFEVFDTPGVAVALELAEILVAHAVYGALDAAPQLHGQAPAAGLALELASANRARVAIGSLEGTMRWRILSAALSAAPTHWSML